MSNSFILVINCGSSSLKFALYDTSQHSNFKPLTLLAEGIAELVSKTQADIKVIHSLKKHLFTIDLLEDINTFHSASLELIISELDQAFSLLNHLQGIGHRVVHGGNVFSKSVLISNDVIKEISACSELAPLHNPANIVGIETLQKKFPETPQVAVFDTAFHQSIPDYAHTYAIPKQWTSEFQIRRYGFHGTSHRYITQQAAAYFEISKDKINIITAHLGNGASVASIKNGESVDTSMGMTPLEGLVMGTRSGDIDPGIFDYLVNKGISPQEINQTLNKKSGLLGISGISNDMRTLCEALENNHPDAKLALEVFCFRAAKYIAAMSVSLNKLDALIFTGGIGENASIIRKMIVEHLSVLGFKIDSSLNQAIKADESLAIAIHSKDSRPILIIPTDEEAMIVSDTLNLIQTP